ncbi:hypothetical protein [Nocardia salmonicida]|uniref:hypothetical protein n=1 Tax=Nocardia salmonicida TaxID=53431 RepID=UPI0012F50F5D|nr:hypothetical protein [Nocardia salmonicida]
MGKPTLLVDVMGFPHICKKCGTEQQWVWAVEARALGRNGMVEAIATDQELPVHIARSVLTAAGRPDVAALLGDRCERGSSFNPNICSHCGHRESWHSLESVVVAGAHAPRAPIASAPHPVPEWRQLMASLRNYECWYIGR